MLVGLGRKAKKIYVNLGLFSSNVVNQKKSLTLESEATLFIIRAVWTRLELATSCVTGRHSNQLNYQTKSIKNYELIAN